jgi:cell division protein FtsI/penicillin-binding protein 2
MLNRPGNILSESEPGPGLREEYGLDRNPGLRLLGLFALIVVPLLIICGKLATLQAFEAEDFIAGFEPRVTESFKPIETTDGRILIDGRELARDVATYRLKVHYRWLEEPPDGLWLRRRARERLSKKDRSDRERVDAAEQEVMAERQRMWQRLAGAIGMTDEQFVPKFSSGSSGSSSWSSENVIAARKRSPKLSVRRTCRKTASETCGALPGSGYAAS